MKKLPGMLLPAALLTATLFPSCGKESKFVFYDNQVETTVSRTVQIKQIERGGSLDVLWVIDNSGSMSQHQANVMANIDQFIRALSSGGRGVDWRIGLASTHVGEAPFIPFDTAGELNSKTPDPVGVFNSAVKRLGLNKGCPELSFQPTLDYLARFPKFAERGGTLAVIMITDTDEETSITASALIDKIAAIKGDRRIAVYTAWAFPPPSGTKCEGEFPWAGVDWAHSHIQEAVKMTNGDAYSLCDPDFGKNLADIGTKLSKMATQSMFYLKERPIVSTLRVSYRGVELKGGDRADGGVWYYDPGKSAIVFYTLDFAPDENSYVDVSYTQDVGL